MEKTRRLVSERESMSRSDKILLQSIVKRQMLIVKDLYELRQNNPDLIESDLVGSLDALYRYLYDSADRVLMR